MTGSERTAAGPAGRAGEATLVDHLREMLLSRPGSVTYRFLPRGHGQPVELADAELDRRARALAAR